MTSTVVDSRSSDQPMEPQQDHSLEIVVTVTGVEHREVMQALEKAEHDAQHLAETPGGSTPTILAAREAVQTIQSIREKFRLAYLAMWTDD